MTHETHTDIVDALDDLLERERAALLTGDIDQINRLVAEKERLIEQLGGQDSLALGELRDKALRNQALIDSALQGIRDVATRLQTLRQVRRSLETYDANGNRRSIEGHVTPRVEKRA